MKLFIVCFLSLYSYALYGQAPETITNQTIIQLQKAGLGKEVIKAKIQSSTCNFDLSTNALVELKKMNISDDIISVMMLPHSVPPVPPTLLTTVTADYSSLRSGIYYLDISTNQYLNLDPSVLSNQKTGGLGETIKRSFSGLFNAKKKEVVTGATAAVSVPNGLPLFLFVFDTTAQGLSSNAMKADVTSPSEFFLVKLTVNGNTREIVTGKSNSVGSNTGIDNQYKVLFNSKKVKNGVFQVTPANELSTGEYGFMFATDKSSSSNKIYDFAVKK